MTSQDPDSSLESEVLYKVENNCTSGIGNYGNYDNYDNYGNNTNTASSQSTTQPTAYSQSTTQPTAYSQSTTQPTVSSTPSDANLTFSFSGKDSCTSNSGDRKKRQASSSNTMPLIDLFLNPDREEELKNLTTLAKLDYIKIFESVTDKSYENMFELLWYSGNPCFDSNLTSEKLHQKSLIKKCEWRGDDIPCSWLFKMSPTDRGMCCVLSPSRDLVFRDSRYSKAIQQLQGQDKLNALDYKGEAPKLSLGMTSWFHILFNHSLHNIFSYLTMIILR